MIFSFPSSHNAHFVVCIILLWVYSQFCDINTLKSNLYTSMRLTRCVRRPLAWKYCKRSSNTEVLSEPSPNSRPPENAEQSGPHSTQGEAFGSGQERKEMERSATATTTTSNRSFGMRTEPCTDWCWSPTSSRRN